MATALLTRRQTTYDDRRPQVRTRQFSLYRSEFQIQEIFLSAPFWAYDENSWPLAILLRGLHAGDYTLLLLGPLLG
ncbi:MAG: hypothetical protein AAGF31_08120 [Planctomycetota bacterium]